MASPNGPSRSHTVARLALVFASIVVAIVLLDVGLRVSAAVAPRRGVLEPTPKPHALTDWIDVFPPGYTGTLTSADFRVGIRAGSLGLRERDLDIDALAGEHPYLFLGDSYFFGWGVEQPQRLSERFARDLEAAGRPVPVVNFSFPGWGTYHYLDVWRRFVPRLQPRMVIVSTFVGNDFTDDLKQSWRGPDGTGAPRPPDAGTRLFRVKMAAREVVSTSPVLSLVDHALWRSPGFRTLFNKFEIGNDRIALYEPSPSALQRELYSATESGLAELARLSAAEHIPVLVVLIPDHLQVLMPEIFRGYDFDRPQRTIHALLASHGIADLDLLPLFERLPSPDDLFFREDKHWNAQGHAFVTAALESRLRELADPAVRAAMDRR